MASSRPRPRQGGARRPSGPARHRRARLAGGRAAVLLAAAPWLGAALGCSSDDALLFGDGSEVVRCEPGERRACYDGPAATVDVGECRAGEQWCGDDGVSWSPCAGQVTPGEDDCRTPADEDCDGEAPPCPPGYPLIDLRADVNRNGTVDENDPTEDADEDHWDGAHGAIFLANLDDDERRCPLVDDDEALAACNDGADERINGDADRLDLAPLTIVAWPEAPDDASATVRVASPGDGFVRLWQQRAGVLELYRPGDPLGPAALRAGVTLALEGIDIARDADRWSGFVELTLEVESGTGPDGPWPDGSDVVQLRVAPVLFRHHLDEAHTVYASYLSGWPGSEAYVADLEAATGAAGVPGGLVRFEEMADQWTQDFFETAYMSMPSETGQQVMHVNFRSANYRGSDPALRRAGRVVFTELRGPDVAGAVQFDPLHPDAMDTLNSFGNFETIPPFVHGGQSWPAGRVLVGATASYYPDPSFLELVATQGVQGVVTIDTSWLLVGHVDETVSFVPASSPLGWAMLVADPALARTMLEAECDVLAPGATPGCAVQLFVGKSWGLVEPAAVSIYEVLTDPDVMNTSAWAAVEIDDQVHALRQATGLGPADLVAVPFLFQPIDGRAVAFQPNTVNSILLSDGDFGAAAPHGPLIDGVDPFEEQLAAALTPFGITVRWIEDWDWYHRYDGDVHCGSNSRRQVPATPWWEGLR